MKKIYDLLVKSTKVRERIPITDPRWFVADKLVTVVHDTYIGEINKSLQGDV